MMLGDSKRAPCQSFYSVPHAFPLPPPQGLWLSILGRCIKFPLALVAGWCGVSVKGRHLSPEFNNISNPGF